MSPHPENQTEWFRRLPIARQVAMSREHDERLQRPVELEAVARRRRRIEALQMGGVFAFFGLVCAAPSFEVLLVSSAVGTALGWVCSRLDATRIPTGAAGMIAFFGAQYVLQGSIWMVLFAIYPLGACCALLGWTREERGT